MTNINDFKQAIRFASDLLSGRLHAQLDIRFSESTRHWQNLARDMDSLRNFVSEHTVEHVDVHYKRGSTVIVIGRYRNNDYVRIFDLPQEDWVHLIERLKEIEPRGELGMMDAYPMVSAVIRREWDRK